MDKVEEIKIKEILKNDNNDLKILYDIKLSHCGASWWCYNLNAYYIKKYNCITRIERPTRTKQNKIIDMLLKQLTEKNYI